MSHVFCDVAAAGPIKSYSPELIVHGCLREGEEGEAAVARQAEAVTRWFPALSALVVGPGLGRDPTLQAVAVKVVESASMNSLPCVIDADGLRIMERRPELLRGRRWTVLTPNRPEYARLMQSCFCEGHEETEKLRHLALCRALEGPVVVRKGAVDMIGDGAHVLSNQEPGALKRSGGQGDVLAGTIATFLSWSKAASEAGRLPADAYDAPLLAAYAGCLLTRRFSAAAFARHRRAMTAPDLVGEIGPVFEAFSPADDIGPVFEATDE